MRSIIAIVLLTATATSAWGQLHPPTLSVHTVGDRTNVFQHVGSDIEVFPTQRAVRVNNVSGIAQVNAVTTYPSTTPYSQSLRGVVFNYALQQYGCTIGEVAFMLKPNSSLNQLPLNASMHAKKILKSGVYVVTANTPQNFLDIVRTLQHNAAVAWVEPHIKYEPVQLSSSIQ